MEAAATNKNSQEKPQKLVLAVTEVWVLYP